MERRVRAEAGGDGLAVTLDKGIEVLGEGDTESEQD
jgi:hypothetical protein